VVPDQLIKKKGKKRRPTSKKTEANLNNGWQLIGFDHAPGSKIREVARGDPGDPLRSPACGQVRRSVGSV
jgi:hypothetical protein